MDRACFPQEKRAEGRLLGVCARLSTTMLQKEGARNKSMGYKKMGSSRGAVGTRYQATIVRCERQTSERSQEAEKLCFLERVSLCSPHTRYADQAGLKLTESTCLCLPSAGLKGLRPHAWLEKKINPNFCVKILNFKSPKRCKVDSALAATTRPFCPLRMIKAFCSGARQRGWFLKLPLVLEVHPWK